jgi:hypothetical protein
MAILESLILPAILPAAMDAIKNLFGGISRRIGGLSVDDQVKMQTADIEKLKALAQLDEVKGTPSQWVVDLRSSFRYLAAGFSIMGGLGLICYMPDLAELGGQLISAPFAFIFGERLYMGLSGKK